MDRLVIENALNDFQHVDVLNPHDDSHIKTVTLMFSNPNETVVSNALHALKKLAPGGITMLIIPALVDGIYNIEFSSPELDEPIKLSNKAISAEVLDNLKSHAQKARDLHICANIQCDAAIEVSGVEFRDTL